jgi:hypothetical protein
VFNTSYPQVRRRLALPALQLCPFTPGILLHTAAGRVQFADPTRRPGQTSEVLRGRLAGPRDMAALGVLSARLAGALPPGTVRGALASGARAAREVLADT